VTFGQFSADQHTKHGAGEHHGQDNPSDVGSHFHPNQTYFPGIAAAASTGFLPCYAAVQKKSPLRIRLEKAGKLPRPGVAAASGFESMAQPMMQLINPPSCDFLIFIKMFIHARSLRAAHGL
jgi:hypothetical protein